MDESTNPMELMTQMMNPEKMGKIFQNINTVMEEKMDKGEFQKDDLKKEAEGMYGNMAQNPMFKNMMGQMQQGAGEGADNGVVEESDKDKETDEEMTKDETRRILKEKIRAKEKERAGR